MGVLIALVLETAMVAEFVVGPQALAPAHEAGQKVAVFAIFFFVFAYGFFIDTASFVYSSEIYPTNIRSRGVAMATATYFLGCILYVTPGATALATISWRYYLIFVVITFLTIFVIYFLYPETKGKSMEELNELFGDEVAVRITNATEEDKKKLREQMKQESDTSDKVEQATTP